PFSASVPQPPSATPFPYTTLFRSQDFADLRAQDPETAQRVLMSQVGLPGSYRRYSRERDYIQAELARGRSKDNIVAESLRTGNRSEEHTSELQSRENLVCRLLLEK